MSSFTACLRTRGGLQRPALWRLRMRPVGTHLVGPERRGRAGCPNGCEGCVLLCSLLLALLAEHEFKDMPRLLLQGEGVRVP